MPIDINLFLQTFIDESLEMLQGIEETLLNLDIKNIDPEDINRIFRFIHSIKSSSVIFNFNSINEFAHTVETFLENVRSGLHQLNQQEIELLLKAVDCLRAMINSVQKKTPFDEKRWIKLNDLFNGKIQQTDNKLSPKEPLTAVTESAKERVVNGWKILFNPNANIFILGNEPTRLFDVLSELGQLEIKVDTTKLPQFSDLNPTECYLAWELILYTDTPKDELQEVFKWVVNDENISINAINVNEEEKTTKIAEAKPVVSLPYETTSIRVATEKIDNLMNLVGELIITESMIKQITEDFTVGQLGKLYEKLNRLEQTTKELQNDVMRIRMVPIEFIFNRFRRMVHDMAQKMGKKVELVISGEQTELDKNMLEKLSDPILHLVRNALDHGLESAELRIKSGKSAVGLIALNAYQEGDNIVIDVTDDGTGLDKEKIRSKALDLGLLNQNEELTDAKIYQLVMQPGFSTADLLSNVSGRGVGLDVVNKNIRALGGEVSILFAEGKGTTFSLRLPLTLAIMDCQLVKIGNQIYTIPLNTITEIIEMESQQINKLDVENNLYQFRGEYIKIIFLNQFFLPTDKVNEIDNKFLIVADVHDELIGLVVDDILSQQQIVIKSLEDNYGKISGISGVTILGDGQIALILDVKAVIGLSLYPDKTLLDLNKEINLSSAPANNEMEQHHPDEIFEFLSFSIGGQEYGIDISEVKEIRLWEKTTLLPNSPSYIKGVVNVRGTIIPVIDIYNLLGLGITDYGLRPVLIILTAKMLTKKRYIGIIVDSVLDASSVNYNKIMHLPLSMPAELMNYIWGVTTLDDKMIRLLNPKSLVLAATEQEKAS